MKKINLFVFAAISIFISSCSTYKNIPYYQDLDRSSSSEETVRNYIPLTINPGDIIGVNVSSRTPEASSVFNYSAKDLQNEVSGYVVDDKGNVNLPLIGGLNVNGLTIEAIQNKIAQQLTVYFKDPVVNVRLLNFKISIYGDVLKPDVYTIKDQSISITKALAMAGDLNISGMRKNVTLIREIDGKRNFIPIDLTSKNIFQSPYYYLKNNDQIYVQPDKMKLNTIERGRVTSIILSALSVVAIVFTTVYR